MKGFKLTDTGDVAFKNNKIELITDSDLTQQSIQYLLSTNKGECFYDENEGITFQNILGKNVEEDHIKSEILQGLLQLDSSFVMTDFSMSFDNASRHLAVTFTAENKNGEVISVSTNY